jgi:N-acetylglutamate synthase-like GNAT family acetyltransferase
MQVRRAAISDVRRIAEIHVKTWRAAYRGQMPDTLLDGLDIEKRAAFWNNVLAIHAHGVLVAEANDNVIGFCHLIPSRDAGSSSIAEIAAIYIQPEHWRQGAGEKLCRAALAEARSQNYSAVVLWVLTTNHSARNFYEAMGFRLDGTTKVDKRFNDHELHEVRFQIFL